MQTIPSAILNLLYEHDCVIVPGLGAFLSRRVGSRFDEQRGLMLPPRKEVVFNADIVHTDGLLADHLSSKNSDNYDAAVRRIEHFVESTLAKLEAGTVVMLPEMGLLKMVDGRVLFDAEPGLNVLIDSYGLSPVAARRLRQDLMGGVTAEGVRRTVASVAVLVALLLVSPRTNNPNHVRADLSQLFQTMASDAAKAEAEALETPVVYELQQTEESSAAQLISVPENTPTKETYYLVVASFLARQEAEDYIASMKTKGVTDLNVLDYEGRCRVVAASFDNVISANNSNRDLRLVQGFEKSWVLRVP